jgi:hypothetical protein
MDSSGRRQAAGVDFIAVAPLTMARKGWRRAGARAPLPLAGVKADKSSLQRSDGRPERWGWGLKCNERPVVMALPLVCGQARRYRPSGFSWLNPLPRPSPARGEGAQAPCLVASESAARAHAIPSALRAAAMACRNESGNDKAGAWRPPWMLESVCELPRASHSRRSRFRRRGPGPCSNVMAGRDPAIHAAGVAASGEGGGMDPGSGPG